jgi:hypothetical protein
VIWLPHAHGALPGTVTVTVERNECSQQAATIGIPAVAVHVAEVFRGSRCSARRATLHMSRRRRRTPG